MFTDNHATFITILNRYPEDTLDSAKNIKYRIVFFKTFAFLGDFIFKSQKLTGH